MTGDPVLADALGQLHGRQHVDQRRGDRDREPRALGEVAHVARLVERRDEPGFDAGGERGERPRGGREGGDAFLSGHGEHSRSTVQVVTQAPICHTLGPSPSYEA